MPRKTLKEQAEEIYGKKKDNPSLKEKLNAWLDDNVNQPLAKRGYEKTGAGISAVGSAAGEMFIPEDVGDVIATVAPAGIVGKGLRALGLGGKKVKKVKRLDDESAKAVEDTAEKVPDVSFSSLKQPPAPKAKIGELNPVQKRKDIRGEKKAIRDSKTREVHDTLQEDVEKELREKARKKRKQLGESKNSPSLDYSKMK